MAVKFKAKTKDEIPTELQSLYVERDGAFVLDVEGAVDKARVDEFRESNVPLMRERENPGRGVRIFGGISRFVLAARSRVGPMGGGMRVRVRV